MIVFLLILASCSDNKKKISIIEEEEIESQMISAYKKGMEALETGEALFAAKKFNEAELLYPQSDWAPKSVLMAAYSYYSQNYLENKNTIYVINWNMRALNPSRFDSSIYGNVIEYTTQVNYGLEVNYKL